MPEGDVKVVFNVTDAPDATLNDSRSITQFVLGDNGPGGTLIVADGGTLNTSAEIWSAIGYNDTARLVVETGGELTFGQHMWVGLTPNSYGTVELNGGTINVGQMTGLGWDGGTGFLYLNDGVINLTGFDPNQSIGDGSFIQVGNGTMNIPGDLVAAVEAYAAAEKIIARTGATLNVVYDADSDMTVVSATAAQQATTVWNPAGNPESIGLWTEAANWSDGFVPDANKVVFNVPDAAPALLDAEVSAVNQFVLGDNGPGGTLIIEDGGILNTSSEIWSAVGYNDTARLVVRTGGVVNFGQHMWVGLTPEGSGTVVLDGGTINVGQMTGLGWDGGIGFVQVNEGELNMNGFDPNQSIGDGSMLEIGDGTVRMAGDQTDNVLAYVSGGKIAARDEDKTVQVVFDSDANQTIITAEESTSVGPVVVAGKLALKQNFPNPFSSSTTVGFDLRESARVRLEVFNAWGQRVAELVNHQLPAGTHQRVWEASDMPAGLYVVKIKANDYSLARQITLAR